MKAIFALTGNSMTDVLRQDVLTGAIYSGTEREMLIYRVTAVCFKDGAMFYGTSFYGLRDLVVVGSATNVTLADRIAAMSADPKKRYFDNRPDTFACGCKTVRCKMTTSWESRIHSHPVGVFTPSPPMGSFAGDQNIPEGETHYLLVKGTDGKLYYVPYTKDSVGAKVEVPPAPTGDPPPPPTCTR